MTESFFIVFVFMGVIAVGMVVFVGWVLVGVLRFVFGGLVGLFKWDPASRDPLPPPTHRCLRHGCQALNPATARFCRRCGHELSSAQVVPQDNMW